MFAELESLLAAQRVREYAGELGVQQGAGQLGAMHQRNRALEQQVGAGAGLWSSILLSGTTHRVISMQQSNSLGLLIFCLTRVLLLISMQADNNV